MTPLTLLEHSDSSDSDDDLFDDRETIPFGNQLFVDQQELLQCSAEHVREDLAYKQQLFEFVLASRDSSSFTIAAANAISVLNLAGVNFSNLDLSRVKVPGANLEGAIMHATNLSGVDLSGCNISRAYLSSAILNSANLRDLRLGEFPLK